MFQASVSKFVECVGDENLIAVPDLNSSEHCNVFQIVIKHTVTKRWFWKSQEYQLTPFGLGDLLSGDSGDNKQCLTEICVRDKKFLEYHRRNNVSLNGQFGVKLKAIFDYELEGATSVNIEGKYGVVNKKVVDVPQLYKFIINRKICLQHQMYQQLKGSPGKSLCVVTSICYLANGGDMLSSVNIHGERTFGDKKLLRPAVDASSEATGSKSTERDILLYPGQPVAFTVCELLIQTDGSLALVLDPDARGGFIKSQGVEKTEMDKKTQSDDENKDAETDQEETAKSDGKSTETEERGSRDKIRKPG